MSGQSVHPVAVVLLGLLGMGGGGWLFASSFKRLGLRRKVANTPTAKVRSAAMGPAELKGLAQPLQQALEAPFSGLPCTWWRITVDQEEIRHTKNGTRREWRQIHASSSDAPFLLQEGEATVQVHPVGAEIHCPKLLEYVSSSGLGAMLGSAVGWLRRIGKPQAGSDGLEVVHPSGLPGPAVIHWLSGGVLAPRRRLREWRIDTKRPLYVLGVLRAGRGGEGPSLGLGRSGEPFIITTESESELLRRLGLGAFGRLLGGAAIILLSLYLALAALAAF